VNAVERSACAKIILCGEHAVVYDRPAIALPLPRLRARAAVEPAAGEGGLRIFAPDIRRSFTACDDASHALMRLAALTLDLVSNRIPAANPATASQPSTLNLQPSTFDARLTIASDIPVAAHLGSSAAVSVAVARAIAASCGYELSAEEASRLAFESEKLHHGTPSGIDNTVVAYEQPVWFRKSAECSVFSDGVSALSTEHSALLVIADTGISTPTRIPVGDVRRGWEAAPGDYERLFDRIAAVVTEARVALLAGDWPRLGELMSANHEALVELGVSCPELDQLCDAARRAGALGAKLSGGGRGGNMIALARDAGHANHLRMALQAAGAARVI